MTEKEIVGKVRKNGGTWKYLHVLSELNGCDVKAIERVLIDAGFKKENDVWVAPKVEFIEKKEIYQHEAGATVYSPKVGWDVHHEITGYKKSN